MEKENLFEMLFPIYCKEDFDYVFISIHDNRLFIAKKGSLLKCFGKSHLVKMRRIHTKFLKDNVINEIIFSNQLGLGI